MSTNKTSRPYPCIMVLMVLYNVEYLVAQTGEKSPFDNEHDSLLNLDHLTFNSGYDGRIRPHLNAGTPDIIRVNLAINIFSEFNGADMDFTINLYLRQMWSDHRLVASANDSNRVTVTLSDKALSDLWVPDLFFPNEKRSWRHDVTTPNVMIRISPEGDVLYSQRLSLKLGCLYNFIDFPMDSQTCEIQMKSYAHTTNDVIYQWDDDPLQTETTLFTPEFTLEDWSLIYNCTGRTVTGEYSCISVKFQLKRDIRFYLLKLYAPTVVVVLLSFLNFFIDPRAVPARVSIGLITVLTITTQSVSIQDRLPTVSYITAADVWLTACLLFVFGSMLEYTAVNVLLQREKKREKKGIGALAGNINKAFRDSFSTNLNGSKVDLHVEVNGALGASEFDKPWLTMSNVDRVAKFVFFIGFAVFNIIYWSVYLIVQK